MYKRQRNGIYIFTLYTYLQYLQYLQIEGYVQVRHRLNVKRIESMLMMTTNAFVDIAESSARIHRSHRVEHHCR